MAGPCPAAMPAELVEVPHRVHGLVRPGRSSGSVDARPGCLAGMDLDQLAAVEDPHQLPVGAHLDPGADQVPGTE